MSRAGDRDMAGDAPETGDGAVLVAAGGNLSAPGEDLAVRMARVPAALERAGLPVKAVSRFYRSAAYPPSDQPDFLNFALRLESGGLDAQSLMARLLAVEARFGRRRETRWGARTLDLDLIALGQTILPDRAAWLARADAADEMAPLPGLTVPHPRAHRRDFVLCPLLDIAPHWHHPVLQCSVRSLWARLGGAGLPLWSPPVPPTAPDPCDGV
ncbi:2-amino-4-hydroxy-6-hydroxymethyldihydropteridine diphosphokinase [Yunchengibacter salinarum]|uniref:2-amino-4-hydroxy-6- hydroxymethyldihydropteridine diphosphokinase n=1 Tax=Yunchengibacter salinarum TaxID=3133399 RepID=UPI0035B5F5A7